MKCEPSETSFDDLKGRPCRLGYWCGVCNYQARNLIRDEMARRVVSVPGAGTMALGVGSAGEVQPVMRGVDR